jgi:3-keto-L-gulonate-6-phosphate decarboxylase
VKLQEREAFVSSMWDQYHRGGLTLSEYATFMAENAEAAFLAGADLATLLAACATIETYLRAELGAERSSFCDLINESDLPDDLIKALHQIRIFRNRWVHVHDPDDDEALLASPEIVLSEIESHAILSFKSMVRTLCSNQWV